MFIVHVTFDTEPLKAVDNLGHLLLILLTVTLAWICIPIHY